MYILRGVLNKGCIFVCTHRVEQFSDNCVNISYRCTLSQHNTQRIYISELRRDDLLSYPSDQIQLHASLHQPVKVHHSCSSNPI